MSIVCANAHDDRIRLVLANKCVSGDTFLRHKKRQHLGANFGPRLLIALASSSNLVAIGTIDRIGVIQSWVSECWLLGIISSAFEAEVIQVWKSSLWNLCASVAVEPP